MTCTDSSTRKLPQLGYSLGVKLKIHFRDLDGVLTANFPTPHLNPSPP